MEKDKFKFSNAQRNDLVCCWKRVADREKARIFINEVESHVSLWLEKINSVQDASIAEIIARSARLNMNTRQLLQAASNTLEDLKNLPPNFAAILNIYFIGAEHGEEYFKQYSEAVQVDKNNFRLEFADAVNRGLTGKNLPQRVTEVSKLPPDFLQQLEEIQGWLASLIQASGELHHVTIGSKNWNNKEPEKWLLFTLARTYKKHLGKHPSSCNGTPFKKLAAELSKILPEHNFGAIIIKECCDLVNAQTE